MIILTADFLLFVGKEIGRIQIMHDVKIDYAWRWIIALTWLGMFAIGLLFWVIVITLAYRWMDAQAEQVIELTSFLIQKNPQFFGNGRV